MKDKAEKSEQQDQSWFAKLMRLFGPKSKLEPDAEIKVKTHKKAGANGEGAGNPPP